MIEAFVVLMLIAVGGGAYVSSWFLTRGPMTEQDLADLKQNHAELAARIEQGRDQKWDAVMLGHMRQQHAEMAERIAKAAV